MTTVGADEMRRDAKRLPTSSQAAANRQNDEKRLLFASPPCRPCVPCAAVGFCWHSRSMRRLVAAGQTICEHPGRPKHAPPTPASWAAVFWFRDVKEPFVADTRSVPATLSLASWVANFCSEVGGIFGASLLSLNAGISGNQTVGLVLGGRGISMSLTDSEAEWLSMEVSYQWTNRQNPWVRLAVNF